MPLNLTQVLEDLYREFAVIERPEQFTNFEHCEECFEHNETMKSAGLETLTASHLGTAGWNPISFLTAQGFAYFMPRLMELLLQEAEFKCGDPFSDSMLFHLSVPADHGRFLSYMPGQCQAILEALKYYNHHLAHDRYSKESIDMAIRYWQTKSVVI
jgi:hypothetical protein